jgi:hypothetical protein
MGQGSCPNVSFQEWNLGEQAIALSMQSGGEEGFAILTSGTVISLNSLLPVKTSTGNFPWYTPPDVVTVVHSHPHGTGLSGDDIAWARASGRRVVSAAAGNLYGSVSSGGPAVHCYL